MKEGKLKDMCILNHDALSDLLGSWTYCGILCSPMCLLREQIQTSGLKLPLARTFITGVDDPSLLYPICSYEWEPLQE